jgi:ribonuclease HI
MKMNVSKTHILSNKDETDAEYPAGLTMGNTMITSYKNKNEISRILGVYISMDGSAKETIKHAIETLHSQITRLNIKFMPSKVAINIINSVVLSKLAYRLQVANVPVTTLRKIDTKLRKLTKKKCSLPLNTPDDFLYDKNYGFSLNSIERILPAQLISNTISMIRSNGTMGPFLHEVDTFYKNHLNVPISIIEAPLKYSAQGKTRDPLAKLISNTLYENKLQIRGIHHIDPLGHITQVLTQEEYEKSYKTIATLKLSKFDDFKAFKNLTSTRPTRSTNFKTLSFNIIDEKFDQLNLKRPEKYLKGLAGSEYAPLWFSQIICYMIKKPFRNIHKDEVCDIPEPIPIPLSKLTNKPDIITAEVFVDGSYKDGEMGSAALFHAKYTIPSDHPYTRSFDQSKPTQHNASTNKAEKWALLRGLEPFDAKTALNVYSDSQITLDAVALIMDNQLSSRDILKIEDYPIIENIKHEMNRFDTLPILHKIKAHDTNQFNNEVDELSKQARKDETLPPSDINI